MKKYIAAFIGGGLAYNLAELAARGRTHVSMTVAGGLSCALLLWVNSSLRRLPFLARCLLGAAVITVIEFFTGCIVNLKLKLAVWDYSRNRLNLLGQICPAFTLLWFLLCLPLTALFSLPRYRPRHAIK